MKICVLSDVHGNVPALAAVVEAVVQSRPDRVVVNGDLINRGPYSQACLDLLRRELPQAQYLKGNHETYTLDARDHPLAPDHPRYELHRFAQWTARQLGDGLDAVAQWPDQIDCTDLDGGSSFHITHGSVLGNRDGIGARTSEADLERKLGSPRALFVASHTHKAMTRHYRDRLVVNTGSVGQPLDGDARASYGEFTYHHGQWQAVIRRIEYDKAQAIADFHESGLLEEGGPLALLIYCEHRLNEVHIGTLMHSYAEAMQRGELSVQAAVDRYLRDSGLDRRLREWGLGV